MELTAAQRRHLLGDLRILREELQNIRAAIAALLPAAEGPGCGPVDRAKASAALRAVMERQGSQVADCLARVHERLFADASVHSDFGDAVARIANAWDDAYAAWTQAPAEISHAAAAVMERHLAHAVLEIGYVTVPPRLAENLRVHRVGQKMSFHDVFRDEHDEEQRKTLLKWLADNPLAVPGIVDVQTGMITRASPSLSRRVASVVLLGGAAAVATTLIAVLLPRVDGLPPTAEGLSSSRWAWLVGMAYAGAGLHVLIAGLKSARRVAGSEPAAIGSWVLWAHVREAYLLSSVLAIALVAVAAVLTLGSAQTTAVTLLAVGYSTDSLVDLVLPRFDNAMTRRTEVIATAFKAGT